MVALGQDSRQHVVNYVNGLRVRDRGVIPMPLEDVHFTQAGFERVTGTNAYAREAKVTSFDASFSIINPVNSKDSLTGGAYVLTHFSKDLRYSPNFMESDQHGLSDYVADIIKEADDYQGL